jgi:hypothetical protein
VTEESPLRTVERRPPGLLTSWSIASDLDVAFACGLGRWAVAWFPGDRDRAWPPWMVKAALGRPERTGHLASRTHFRWLRVLLTLKRQEDPELFVPKPSRRARRLRLSVPDVRRIVHRRPLASVPGDSRSYSLGYSGLEIGSGVRLYSRSVGADPQDLDLSASARPGRGLYPARYSPIQQLEVCHAWMPGCRS